MKWWLAAVGIGVALCAGQSRSAAEPACPPAAIVSGEDGAAIAVRMELHNRGVRTQPAPACPAVHAWVTRQSERLSVQLRDAAGRNEQRVLSNPEIAAMWIESWTRNDLEAPLLPVAIPARARPAPALYVRSSAPGARPVVSTRAPTSSPALYLGASAETATASDDSSWTTFGVSGCVLVGGVCVGVLARYGRNLGFSDTEAMVVADRTATELALSAGVPVALGRGTLMPELSIGGRWSTSRGELANLGIPVPCEPNDPTNPDPSCTDPATTTALTKSTTNVRLGARLIYALPVAASMALTLELGAGWIPGAHTDDFTGDPIVGPDGTIVEPDPLQRMPGEPSWMWTAGIGLRVELQ